MINSNFAIIKTLSLDYETIEILKEFNENTKIAKSKLVREFIKFFRDNKEEFDKLIKSIKKAEEKPNVNI